MEDVSQTSSSEVDGSSVGSSELSLFEWPVMRQGGGHDCGDSDGDIYYFESDHVALRGSPDYQLMLRVMGLLEAQRLQALHDLDALHAVRDAALADPIQFVEKLQNGVNPNLPQRQKVACLPYISWEHYTSSLDLASFGSHSHMTRLKRSLVDGDTDEPDNPAADSGSVGDGDASVVVRGRIKTETKPDTFNKLWTVEEQKRLEDLLVQNPPEEVEAKRWQKIAETLGNRTPTQVASRVQKYFIKLAKAGLPIPGRRPNLQMYKNKTGTGYRQQQRHQRHYQQCSTFLQGYMPPVYMSDDDDSQDCWSDSSYMYTAADHCMDEAAISDDESVPLQLRESDEYHELIRLVHLRHERLHSMPRPPTQHVGFKCDRCEVEPIVGTRWHCVDCPPDIAVDFCDHCLDSSFETEQHNCSHRLKPKHQLDDTNYVDTDYMSFMPGSYNYLDPNYMPAS